MTPGHPLDRPLVRRYARVERERRFLLRALPPAVDPDGFERLEDLFVAGTHVRLRLVFAPDGRFLVAKLGQKVPAAEGPDDPRLRDMTTIYLPRDEAAVFATLPGLRATKRRYQLREQGLTFCIDVWEAPITEVIVAEVEADSTAALEAVVRPTWALREVTDDSAYSALALARGRVPLDAADTHQ